MILILCTENKTKIGKAIFLKCYLPSIGPAPIRGTSRHTGHSNNAIIKDFDFFAFMPQFDCSSEESCRFLGLISVRLIS